MTDLPTGATQVVAVIGDPIAHSLSPAIHNAAFRVFNLDMVFVAFAVPPGITEEAIRGIRALGLRGVSVTMPHKSDAARLVDELTPDATALASVNAVVRREDGSLLGDSTDGPGFVDSLQRKCGFDPRGMRCVVAGAGGAARAIVLALARAGAEEVVVVNRSADRAHAAAVLADRRGRVGTGDDIEGADLVVNATPIGMAGGGEAGRYLVDPSRLGPGQLAADIVYNPSRTPFLIAAEEAGAETVGGIGMLVHQAARAFTMWTGLAAPVEEMYRAAVRAAR